MSGQLLHVIRLLNLGTLRDVGIEEIKEAARGWAEHQRSNPKARSYDRTASYFEYVAKKWLRFAGRLQASAAPCT